MTPFLLLALLGLGQTPVLKETPPAPSAPRRVTLPTPMERRLPNGLRVIAIPKRGTGLLSVVLSVADAGGSADPATKAGLASFTASLLTRGTQTRSATQIAREIESLGGTLNADAGWDSAVVNLSVLRTNREAAVALMADAALHPAFAPDEVVRLRTETRDDLQVSLEEPGTLARYAAARVVFGASAYGHPLGGTLESLPQLTRADTTTFYKSHFSPAQAVLIFGGDIDPDEAFALAEKGFGGWKTPAAAKPGTMRPTSPATTPLAGHILVIDKPDAGQAAVVVTRRSIARRDPDYYAVTVADDVLGGGYSSRLNREVRVKRGLAYGAGSSVAARRSIGPFVASSQTKNESAAEVAQLLMTEMRRLSTASALGSRTHDPESRLVRRVRAWAGKWRGIGWADGCACHAQRPAFRTVRLFTRCSANRRVRRAPRRRRTFIAERGKRRDCRRCPPLPAGPAPSFQGAGDCRDSRRRRRFQSR